MYYYFRTQEADMRHVNPKAITIAKRIKKPDPNDNDVWVFLVIAVIISTMFLVLWVHKMYLLANGE
jgi:hypothetical protein